MSPVHGSAPLVLPIGAEPVAGGGVRFRVWAPARHEVTVLLESGPGSAAAIPLQPEGNGYHSELVGSAGPGTRYRYRPDGDGPFPDPASRYQPEGPHGPSQVVDPGSFAWTDGGWRGLRREGQVLYEMHVGTFTQEGTWRAAMAELPRLAELGITAIEMMPVADFPGRFGWGYDGVSLFAPTRLYGEPDDLRRFVDSAHGHGIGVILDVVYNHLGPDGNFLARFSADYFTDRYANEWGAAINFDGPEAGPVREFFIANAGYWIGEFHMDGLRLDATQQMFDASPEHVLAAIARRVREAAPGRGTLIIGENEPQQVRMLEPPERGGCGLDALWNDDFHHSVRVAVTGRTEAYFSNYRGTPQELVSTVRHGYLYQGQYYPWQGKRRGTPAFHVPAAAFVQYIQNHDQVANSAGGARLHALTSPGRWRAATALLLLAPGTPMLFQGQEFAASTPFLYFADHNPELATKVWEGRRAFLSQFRTVATPEVQRLLANPSDPATFEQCRLRQDERVANSGAYALHRDLLRLRREDPAFRRQRRGAVEGAVLAEECLVLRFFVDGGGDRLLVVNPGRDLQLRCPSEPLLGPVPGRAWQTLWSSEDPQYGGAGTAPLDGEDGWMIPGHAAVVLAPGAGKEQEV